jgi:hypothetical protein
MPKCTHNDPHWSPGEQYTLVLQFDDTASEKAKLKAFHDAKLVYSVPIQVSSADGKSTKTLRYCCHWPMVNHVVDEDDRTITVKLLPQRAPSLAAPGIAPAGKKSAAAPSIFSTGKGPVIPSYKVPDNKGGVRFDYEEVDLLNKDLVQA